MQDIVRHMRCTSIVTRLGLSVMGIVLLATGSLLLTLLLLLLLSDLIPVGGAGPWLMLRVDQ